jgi:MOSC domain-containing protein YiiM
MKTNGKVLSVNVGTVRAFEYKGRPAKSAIWKTPVVGRIAVRGVNLEGDDQADRQAHGGPDKALYAYAIEDLRWWEEELARSLPFGQFGENVTTEGIAVNDALVGERWEIGSTVLEVSEPRVLLAGGLELEWTIPCSRADLLKHCDLGHTCESLLRAM